MKFLDPLLVDGSILNVYLSRLAENTVQLVSRLEACEQRSELLQEELEQVKNSSSQANKKIQHHEERLVDIQKQLNSGKDNLDSSRSGSTAKTGGKVSVEENFFNEYLKWKAKVGDVVKKWQVVAVCCMSKKMVIEYGSIGAPADGVLLERLFPDGANLHGKNMVIGYTRTR